jgi:hypothetical protein
MAISPSRLAVLSGVSAVLGVALWFGFVAVHLNYYDEQANPWWLAAWFVVSALLFLAGAFGVLMSIVAEVARWMRA